MKFSFGTNWLSYSKHALKPDKISAARISFQSLLRPIELRGKRFLDIGFGQGLPLFLASEAGADVFGIDIDPVSNDALAATHRFFPSCPLPKTRIVSILDSAFIREQKEAGGFDVVYSWGVLHHTGDMNKAFAHASELVRPYGYLIIAIYNKHWTSPWWRAVKSVFNGVPRLLQEAMVLLFYPILYLRALRLSQGGRPLAARGMDLRHDIWDWLGGLPYEYAAPPDVERTLARFNFQLLRCERTEGFTGCNEFLFQKMGPP